MSINQGKTPGVAIYVLHNGVALQFVVDHLLDVRACLAQIRALSINSALAGSENAIADLEISMYLRSFEKLRYRFTEGELHPLEESE
jgi:hypothetical protein